MCFLQIPGSKFPCHSMHALHTQQRGAGLEYLGQEGGGCGARGYIFVVRIWWKKVRNIREVSVDLKEERR